MGTMHLATKEAYTYADIAKKYILKAAVYAGEMNLGESVDEDLTSFFLSPGGKLFQENFRPKVYKKYQTLVRKRFMTTKYTRHFTSIIYWQRHPYLPCIINLWINIYGNLLCTIIE